jgi:hypothetical protein
VLGYKSCLVVNRSSKKARISGLFFGYFQGNFCVVNYLSMAWFLILKYFGRFMMKLKYFICSLGIVGLVSSPVFAHHHPRPALANQNFNHFLVTANQNVGRSSGHESGWFNRIHVHGGLNIDSQWGPHWVEEGELNVGQLDIGNILAVVPHERGISGMDGKSLSINDFYLSIFSRINSWTQLRARVNYFSTSRSYGRVWLEERQATGGADHTFRVDQAFLTFGNMNDFPIYFQVGKSYLPFGQYKLHPMVKPMTQVLSEVNIENAQLGIMLHSGLYGGAYVYESAIRRRLEGRPVMYGVYGAFDSSFQNIRYDLGVAYNSGMNNVTIINARRAGFIMTSKVGAMAAHANAYVGPFDFHLRWVGALSRFDVLDLPFKRRQFFAGAADINSRGAKPSAITLKAGFVFYAPVINKRTHAFVGYQSSHQASALAIPESRYELGAEIDMWKDVLLAIHVVHNDSYGLDDLNWNGNSADRASINPDQLGFVGTSLRRYTNITVRVGARL